MHDKCMCVCDDTYVYRYSVQHYTYRIIFMYMLDCVCYIIVVWYSA